MKKLIFPFVIGAALLVSGCSDEKEGKNNQANSTSQSDELTIIKSYDTDLGKLEAYFINDEIELTHEENDIGLKVTSVEYGKVLINEQDRHIYENLADEDGNNTYIKVGVELDAEEDAYKKDSITFHIYMSDLEVQGKKVQADNLYSDKIYLNNGKVEETEKGYLYFIVDTSMPFTSLKLSFPAPFDSSGYSISDNYEFKIEL